MPTSIHAVMEDANHLNTVVQDSVKNIVATDVIAVVAESQFWPRFSQSGVCSNLSESVIEELLVSHSLLSTPYFLSVFENILEVAASLRGDVNLLADRH